MAASSGEGSTCGERCSATSANSTVQLVRRECVSCLVTADIGRTAVPTDIPSFVARMATRAAESSPDRAEPPA